MPTQRTLRLDEETVIYCYDDGYIEWNVKNGIYNGIHKTKGSINHDGYLTVKIHGKKYFSHRIIALAFIGKSSLPEIDHINRIRTDNSVKNLRYVNHSENMLNTKKTENCLKKYGVLWSKNRKEWRKAYDFSIKNKKMCITRPDGITIHTGILKAHEITALKQLTQKERYFAYQELKSNRNVMEVEFA